MASPQAWWAGLEKGHLEPACSAPWKRTAAPAMVCRSTLAGFLGQPFPGEQSSALGSKGFHLRCPIRDSVRLSSPGKLWSVSKRWRKASCTNWDAKITYVFGLPGTNCIKTTLGNSELRLLGLIIRGENNLRGKIMKIRKGLGAPQACVAWTRTHTHRDRHTVTHVLHPYQGERKFCVCAYAHIYHRDLFVVCKPLFDWD